MSGPEREALATLLEHVTRPHLGRTLSEATADAVIAAGWQPRAELTTEALAEIKASVWDEGYRQGVSDEAKSQDWTDGAIPPGRVNPYRLTAIEVQRL